MNRLIGVIMYQSDCSDLNEYRMSNMVRGQVLMEAAMSTDNSNNKGKGERASENKKEENRSIRL